MAEVLRTFWKTLGKTECVGQEVHYYVKMTKADACSTKKKQFNLKNSGKQVMHDIDDNVIFDKCF